MGGLVFKHEKIENGRRNWSVTDGVNGVHVWAEESSMHEYESHFGGIEIHSSEPLYDGDECYIFNCWLLGGRCYTDGSSLQFKEQVLPMIDVYGVDSVTARDFIFSLIKDRFEYSFGKSRGSEGGH